MLNKEAEVRNVIPDAILEKIEGLIKIYATTEAQEKDMMACCNYTYSLALSELEAARKENERLTEMLRQTK